MVTSSSLVAHADGQSLNCPSDTGISVAVPQMSEIARFHSKFKLANIHTSDFVFLCGSIATVLA
jgi:hypothetical protein